MGSEMCIRDRGGRQGKLDRAGGGATTTSMHYVQAICALQQDNNIVLKCQRNFTSVRINDDDDDDDDDDCCTITHALYIQLVYLHWVAKSFCIHQRQTTIFHFGMWHAPDPDAFRLGFYRCAHLETCVISGD